MKYENKISDIKYKQMHFQREIQKLQVSSIKNGKIPDMNMKLAFWAIWMFRSPIQWVVCLLEDPHSGDPAVSLMGD